MPIIKTHDLCRFYTLGNQTVRAVDGVSLSVKAGEFVAVTGASGSGKSTLLSLMAGLDTPTSGYIESGRHRLDQLSRRELSDYRAKEIGVIFQSFNLLSHHTALKNVIMGLYFQGFSDGERRRRAEQALDRLGLGERVHHRPLELSGGEQQRVAIARALAKDPQILFADEPTGNLDHDNADDIAGILKSLHQSGMTIVLVTHDVDMAERLADRVVHMHYGKLQ